MCASGTPFIPRRCSGSPLSVVEGLWASHLERPCRPSATAAALSSSPRGVPESFILTRVLRLVVLSVVVGVSVWFQQSTFVPFATDRSISYVFCTASTWWLFTDLIGAALILATACLALERRALDDRSRRLRVGSVISFSAGATESAGGFRCSLIGHLGNAVGGGGCWSILVRIETDQHRGSIRPDASRCGDGHGLGDHPARRMAWRCRRRTAATGPLTA